MSELSEFSIRLSPNGKRAGIAFAGDTHQVAVAVLPKLWTDGPAHIQVHWDKPDLLVVAHELDTLTIEASREKIAVLKDLTKHSQSSALKKRRAPLVAPATALPPSRQRESEGDILALLQLRERIKPLGKLGIEPDRRVAAEESTAWLLRSLVHLQFVDELERVTASIRPGYRSVVEELTAVRGRVRARGLLKQRATGAPRLECEYEEFTINTPLTAALMTALDVVASGNQTGVLAEDKHIRRVPQRALTLRRALGSVPSIPRAAALGVLTRQRLDRFHRHWEEAVRLAVMVLRAYGFTPDAASDRSLPAFELDVPTDEAWEFILERGLATRLSKDHFRSQSLSLPPWQAEGVEEIKPDLLARIEGTMWCIDAKYKPFGLGRKPDGDDLYQIFAYSHLARWNNQAAEVERCALIYPSKAPDPKRIQRYTRNPAHTKSPTLDTALVPFPRPEDVSTNGRWNEYLSSVGAALFDQVLLERDPTGNRSDSENSADSRSKISDENDAATRSRMVESTS